MNIGQAAAACGVSPATLRHYEALGLLGPRHVARTSNGYRTFTPEGLDRARLVVAGRDVGLTLEQIGAHIDRWESGEMSDGERVALFTEHLHRLEERIAAQIRLRDYLRDKLDG